jgi:hypothetical protein
MCSTNSSINISCRRGRRGRVNASVCADKREWGRERKEGKEEPEGGEHVQITVDESSVAPLNV